MAFKDGGKVGHLSPGPGTSTKGPGGANNPGVAKTGSPPPNPMPDAGAGGKPKGGPAQPAGQPIYTNDDDSAMNASEDGSK